MQQRRGKCSWCAPVPMLCNHYLFILSVRLGTAIDSCIESSAVPDHGTCACATPVERGLVDGPKHPGETRGRLGGRVWQTEGSQPVPGICAHGIPFVRRSIISELDKQSCMLRVNGCIHADNQFARRTTSITRLSKKQTVGAEPGNHMRDSMITCALLTTRLLLRKLQ